MARNIESDLDFNGTGKILNLPSPSTSGEAANKQYVDDQNALQDVQINAFNVSTTPQSVSSANAAGTSTAHSRADHVHAHGNIGGGSTHSNVTTSVAGFMSAADKTLLDGFNVSVTPATVAAANAVGTSTAHAKADHVHAHGALGGGTTHAGATTSVAGFLSAADKIRLNLLGLTLNAKASSTTTTSSGTDVAMSGTTLTNPAAGTYLLIATANIINSTDTSTSTVSVYVGGVLLTDSAQPFTQDKPISFTYAFSDDIVLNGSQSVEIRYKSSIGTITARSRSVTLVRTA